MESIKKVGKYSVVEDEDGIFMIRYFGVSSIYYAKNYGWIGETVKVVDGYNKEKLTVYEANQTILVR